jgi:hypothetical protein
MKEMRSPNPTKSCGKTLIKDLRESQLESSLDPGAESGERAVADRDVRDDSRQDAGATLTAF